MKNEINDSCKGRGCRITILPADVRIEPIYSKMFSTRHDISKVFYIPKLSMDKKLAKERS